MCLLFLIIPNRAKLIAPKINFDEITDWNQKTSNNLTQWIEKLAICESSNNPLAVNPKDKDGRPKYGLFQFDIRTWKMYITRYNLFNYQKWEEADWWNAIYSDYHQEIVLREMIENGVDLAKEFGCIKKIGLFDNQLVIK
ncbi:MAG: hypothetical protein NT145_03610 [Elusimicrobia bacterium]|nr:hypothetical protein [Elusimicrobiota bacterium]